MSGRLVVEMAALKKAADDITAAAQVAETVHDQGADLLDKSVAGGQPDAVHGLATLFAKWSYGAGLLQHDAEELAASLGQVCSSLTSLDQRLAEAAE